MVENGRFLYFDLMEKKKSHDKNSNLNETYFQ